MKQHQTWILPEGIEEILPPQARQLDLVSRQLLDFFYSWGYELIIPPLIEYLESLLIGSATDLDLQTFKMMDQISGRMMGIRADLTPQVARIDSHHFSNSTISRLCYFGSVLQTKVTGLAGSRSPMQMGVELYGHQGIESDIEIIQLMIGTLKLAGINELYLDIGHVGIYRELVKQAELSTLHESELFDIINRKSKPDLESILKLWGLNQSMNDMFISLMDLNGDVDVIVKAKKILANANQQVFDALKNLERVVTDIQKLLPDININCDLAELRGYHYHTGVVFSAFVPGHGEVIAQGGRYDNIAEAFDNPRPATGFSTDLRKLLFITSLQIDKFNPILAPYDADDESLQLKIKSLRIAGEQVIIDLPSKNNKNTDNIVKRILVRHDSSWQVTDI